MEICKGDYYLYNNKILESNHFSSIPFQYGISIYEVIRLINGIPLFIERHCERFNNSGLLAKIHFRISVENANNAIKKLSEKNNICNGNIKIIYNNYKGNETLWYFFIPHKYPSSKEYELGVITGLLKATRDNPNIKQISNIRNLADKYIRNNNVYEVLLTDDNNNITEGSRSNFFCIRNDKVYTSPLKCVLSGITRQFVFGICQYSGIEIIETNLSYDLLINSESAFITGTSPKILPVSKINDLSFRVNSKILRKLMVEYNFIIEKYVNSNLNIYY